MKLIIDIPEEVYEICKQMYADGDARCAEWHIANGTPYEERENVIMTEEEYAKFRQELINASEVKGDLISREALKKDIDFQYICKCCHNVNGNVCDICHISEIEKKIDNAPTVEITEEQAIDKLNETGWLPEHDRQMTERPQGKKIKKRHYGWVYCSECDSLLGQQDKFCWNCGADMRDCNRETTFDDYLKEQLKDPEFRKEWEKLQDEDIQKEGKEE